MTATSALVAEPLLIATNLHSFDARDLAASLMRLPIDSDAAFEARAHAAQRRAVLPGD
jgi:hypothetical protein